MPLLLPADYPGLNNVPGLGANFTEALVLCRNPGERQKIFDIVFGEVTGLQARHTSISQFV